MLNQAEVVRIVDIERSGDWTKFTGGTWPELTSRKIPDLREIARELGRYFPPQDFYSKKELLATTANEASEALRNLKLDGYHVFPQRIPVEVVNQVRDELSTKQYLDKSSGLIRSGFNNLIRPRGGSTKWITDMQDVVECSNVLALSAQRPILNLVRSYLDVEPILMQTNCWWSTPAGKVHNDPDASAQLFHQDNEFLSFVKVFIYLNDVSLDNGPHRLVSGSHLDYQDLFPDRKDPSDRLSEDQITDRVNSRRIQTIVGEAGTVIAVDTTALHAGSLVRRGYRAMLQFEYASSPYFSTVQPLALSARVRSEELPDFPDNARFLLNFRNDDYRVWKEKDEVGWLRPYLIKSRSVLRPYLRHCYRVLRRRPSP